MMTLVHGWQALLAAATGHPVGMFVFGVGCLAVVQAIVGLGRSRQWPLLPLVFGLTVLAGFLLNPLADASASQQLRLALARHDVLTSLAIVQMILAAAALACSLRLLAGRRERLWAVLLAAVHTLPAPALVVALLFWEQAWLHESVGARPEAVGWSVGLLAATAVTLPAALAMLVPRRPLAAAHLLLSGAVVLSCMFVPLLPIPLPGMRLLAEPVGGAHGPAWIALGALIVAVIAWGFRRGPAVA